VPIAATQSYTLIAYCEYLAQIITPYCVAGMNLPLLVQASLALQVERLIFRTVVLESISEGNSTALYGAIAVLFIGTYKLWL